MAVNWRGSRLARQSRPQGMSSPRDCDVRRAPRRCLPCGHRFARRRSDLELDRALGLVLQHDGARCDLLAMTDVAHPKDGHERHFANVCFKTAASPRVRTEGGCVAISADETELSNNIAGPTTEELGGESHVRDLRSGAHFPLPRGSFGTDGHGKRALIRTPKGALLPTGSTPDAPHHSLTNITTKLRAAGCVYAEDEARLLVAAGRPSELAAMIEQRAAGLPLEYILGWAEFCGRRIPLEAGVFIPRRRTEFLARQAVEIGRPGAVVLDLCCGSGAVGAVLAAAISRIDLLAADIDPVAVRCARHNLAPWGGKVYEGDLFAPLPLGLRGRVNLLVATAPYVPSKAIEGLPREARIHEPRLSLDGGPDGHHVQRRLAAHASLWLAPGGCLLMETGERQAAQTAEIFKRNGLMSRIVRSNDWDATVIIGTKRGGSCQRPRLDQGRCASLNHVRDQVGHQPDTC